MTSEETTIPISKPNLPSILWTTGRRKSSIAQVRMVPSKNGGKVTINHLSPQDYFKGNRRQEMVALQSYSLVKGPLHFDLHIKTVGGGITGQSEAIRYGIARALVRWDPKLKPILRKEGFLTRDPRSVERKKSGQPKARKRFQYSKR